MTESVCPQKDLESLEIPLDSYFEICGIDEAGRGSLAGSLFVCGVLLSPKTPKSLLESLRDSKALCQKKRDFLALEIKKYAKFHCVEKSAGEIDKKGLSACMRESLLEIMEALFAHYYVFDGNCSFKIPHLKTLIKGDTKLHAISAASIIAKSAKDAQMAELHLHYPPYDFDSNKGYGTKAHLSAISKYGLCPQHRKSYRIKELHSPSLF